MDLMKEGHDYIPAHCTTTLRRREIHFRKGRDYRAWFVMVQNS